ncbi:MAG: peptide MFS transporter [Bacteroidales bacterium]|nr:peptide MFS transporter [Bacteroidales bacterium]MCF8337014.1 peptide MFS transporter [Bacteroidales bacterium]
MFSGHPKGLFVAFFANMGERFSYYTMLAIFVLFLQARFNMSAGSAGDYYGGFLFGIYFLPILGGIIADRWGYGRTIMWGLTIAFIGKIILTMPGFTQEGYFGINTELIIIIVALFVISLGTGLFKGNLQALVGKLYDEPRFAPQRDNAFNIFYMGINIGAFLAPFAATGAVNYVLGLKNFAYENSMPHLATLNEKAHPFLDKMINTVQTHFTGAMHYNDKIASIQQEMGAASGSITEFANTYTQSLSYGYSSALGVAAVAMIISLIVFQVFRKHFSHADLTQKQAKEKAAREGKEDTSVTMSKEEEKKRLVALSLIFITVAFFWMAFHQNGFTLTIFARDYTVSEVSKFNYMFFDLRSFIPILVAIGGLILMLRRKAAMKFRGIGAALFATGAALAIWAYSTFESNPVIEPQLFQSFNPIFIVFLTPLIVGFFIWLRKRGKEPSSPRKIGTGMFITALGFVVMMIAAFQLQSVTGLSPYWLISTYFVLTIAELFLSPIGISFVAKVAPPRFSGLAQGGWLGATAIGNLLAGLVGKLWDIVALWQFFLLLVVLTLLSGIFIFSIMKTLENASQSSENK